jgi:hypothetical protein
LEEIENKYGILLNKDIKLHRTYFAEMCKLIGINVIYRSPKKDKHWTTYGEINSNYNAPQVESCIFEEHPNQRTLKKLGWVSELQENASLISVRYDLDNIQQGSLFIVPSGIDTGKGRLFRVTKLYNIMIYPASITCEIVPEYENTIVNNDIQDFKHNSFNLLNEEEYHL